jgi:hypothetical protein
MVFLPHGRDGETTMWRIADNTNGRVLAALKEHWSSPTATDALECRHGFGAAMDIADELTYLGFERHKDFDLYPAQATVLPPAVCK